MQKFMFVVMILVCPVSAGHGHGPGSETSGLNALVREILGGGHLRNFVQKHWMEHIPDVRVGSAVSPVTYSKDLKLKEQTFVSMPMTLLNGEITNKWLPIDWPHGHIAIQGFGAELVQMLPDGKVPPASSCCGGPHEAARREVYMHHWTVNKWQLPGQVFEHIVKEGGLQYELNRHSVAPFETLMAGAGLQSGANGPCFDSNLHLYFGIGNEVRGTPLGAANGTLAYKFPEPYGVEFDTAAMGQMGQFMVLNTHLIDLRGVEDHNLRPCAECECKTLGSHGADPRNIGGLTCCHSTIFDGGRCPVANESARTNRTYYIRYTIRFRDFDDSVKPLEVITFDATDNGTKWGDFNLQGGFPEKHVALYNDPKSMATVFDPRSGDFDMVRTCHVEYYVPSCQPGDRCVHVMHNSWVLPYPIDIVFIRNHFHAGGLNMTTKTDRSDICVGHGTYDRDHFLADISTCTAGLPSLPEPVRVAKGETLSVETVYSQDQLPHYGVMAMSFVYAHVPRVSDALVV